MAPKFQRAHTGKRRKNTKDARGTVRIQIAAVWTLNKVRHGNISRTMSVANAKVSAVAAAIERALFG